MLQSRFSKHLVIILIGMLVGLLLAGLHPFNFVPKNEVHWLQAENGLRFAGYGQVVGTHPLSLHSVPSGETSSAVFTIELWAASREVSQTKLIDILSIYRSRDDKPFAIESWRRGLGLEGFVEDQTGHRSLQHIGVGPIFAGGVRRFVTVTTGDDGTAIYVDGSLEVRNPALRIARESANGILLLGQTARGGQDWNGDILGLAVYPRVLIANEIASHYEVWTRGRLHELRERNPDAIIYPFNEKRGTLVHCLPGAHDNLTIPPRFYPLDPVILERPSYRALSNISDVTLNILGFIPLGGLLVIYWRDVRGWSNSKAVAAAVWTGLLLSLAIELLQVFLPSRNSSLLDLIDNTLGSGIGAGLAVVAYPWLQKVLTIL
jgi:VanZ family protein